MLVIYSLCHIFFFFFSSRRRHTSCALVTGVQTCALPIFVPGAVRTPMLQRAMDNDAGLEPYLNSIHPIGRFSEPHEQAQAAVWLLSDAASFVTGSCLAADGGFTAI